MKTATEESHSEKLVAPKQDHGITQQETKNGSSDARVTWRSSISGPQSKPPQVGTYESTHRGVHLDRIPN